MISVCKIFTFQAAHKLEKGYIGPCANIHGHSYKLEVEVAADERDHFGMVVDFKELKEIVHGLAIRSLDHQYLNDLWQFNPTAENIIAWLSGRLSQAFQLNEQHRRRNVRLTRLRLWETETCYAEWKNQRTMLDDEGSD